MAIKFSCGSCGKRFSAKDEHAGRRSKCPVCGWDISVPMPATREPGNPQSLVSPPLPSVLARVARAEDSSEPEAEKPKEGGKRRIATWLIASTALVGPIALVLAIAGGYARLTTAARDVAPKSVVGTKVDIPVPAPKAAIRFDPAIIERLARMYPERAAREVFGRGEGIEGVRILESHVRRAAPDPRKIPWLWEGGITFEVLHQDKSDQTPVRLKMLYHLSPEGEEWECWRDVTILIGEGFTRHNDMQGSEWTRDFRKLVVSEWKQSFDFYTEGTSAEQRSKNRQYREKVVAERLGITVVELEEILEATD